MLNPGNQLRFFLDEAGFLSLDLVLDGFGLLFDEAAVVPLLPSPTCCLAAGPALALPLPVPLKFFAGAR